MREIAPKRRFGASAGRRGRRPGPYCEASAYQQSAVRCAHSAVPLPAAASAAHASAVGSAPSAPSSRGLEPTVDPTMMVLQPSEGATWSSLAVDLYGDEARARLLRHYNEGMEAPGDLVFVPAVDDLGPEPTVRKVEVLDGESMSMSP